MPEFPNRLAAALADRYRIERELGRGGMATVYLAQDLKHDRKVALKVLKPELAAVLGAERFVQEIKTTAALQHPHILPLFDSGTADSFLYYVMPYIEGETLRNRLDRETQLGIDEAVRITCDVADALDYAHRHGVIHRDIKPENILLHDGRPMVADFGIALALSAAAGGRMTETGLSLGTPHYMSPEQATAEKEITARSDVYSLGSVLYEMLTGNPPHTGASAQQIIMKIVTEEAAPVTKLRKSVPTNVAAAVARSIEKLPADRFDSARAFTEALSNPAFTTTGAVTAGTGLRAGNPGVSRRTFAATAALAAVLLLTTLWGWLGSSRQTVAASAWRTTVEVPDSAPAAGTVSLSADGSVLTYDVTGPRGRQIWMRRSDATAPRPIPGTEGGTYPALSPDGRRVAFKAAGKLFVVSVEGGTPTLVTDSAQLNDAPAWADDDHLISSDLGGLFRVPATGGALERLTKVNTAAGEGFHIAPSALPDGKSVLFVTVPRGTLDASTLRIAVVGPGGGTHQVLMAGTQVAYAAPGHLLVRRAEGTIVAVPFDLSTRRTSGNGVPIVAGLSVGTFSLEGRFGVAPDGRMVYVLGNDLSSSTVVVVDRRGTARAVDSAWTGVFQSVALSPDARRLAVGHYTNNGEEIELRDLSDGSTVRVEMAGRFLRTPVFSRDGQTMVFAGLAAGMHGIYLMNPSGRGSPQPILTSSDLLATPALSPDGKTLYYVRYGPARREIVVHRLDGDSGATVPLLSEGTNSWGEAPSPDGRWLAYSAEGTGGPGLYVRATDPARGERWEITRSTMDRLAVPRWSRDGHELYYVASDTMFAVQLAGGNNFAIVGHRALFSTVGYRPSFDLFPDGRFVMIHLRSTPGQVRFVMLDDWKAVLPK